MATTLARLKVSQNLGAVVSSAIDSVRAIRSTSQAQKEADFQKAVADGLSYGAQVQFRQQQLDDEKASSFSDPEYVGTLTSSITSLKKLSRFTTYRAKYQASLADLSSGKITAEQQLGMLKDQLATTTDPDLQNEIQGEITTATSAVKTYHDTILSNEVKKAQNDGSPKILTQAINDVKDKRSLAQLNGNDEEVSAYDNTLTVLKSQLGQVTIEDAMNASQVKSITKGLGAFDKIDELSSQIANADSTVSVVIAGKRYSSAQDYWTQLRDGYIAGNGTGIWKDMFTELKSFYTENVDAAVARDGYASTMTLDGIKNNLDSVKNRPEMQPYLDRINTLESNVLAYAFDSTAKKIINTASFTGDFGAANSSLLTFAKTYGVDAESYRLQLANEVASQALQQNVAPAAALAGTGLTPETFKSPQYLPTPTAAPTPTTPSTTTPEMPKAPAGQYTIAAGDTLSAIAAKNGTTLAKVLELNPQFKANPNAIKPGQSLNLPGTPSAAVPPTPTPENPTPTTPVVPPVAPTGTPTPTTSPAPQKTAPLNAPTSAPTGAPTTMPATTPTPTVTPKPTTPASAPAAPQTSDAFVTAQPVQPTQPLVPSKTYVVKSGDTLSTIAKNLLGDSNKYTDLAKSNGIADPNKIKVGMTIKY